MNDTWHHVGVDWANGAWVAVGYPTDGPPGVAVYDTIEQCWNAHGDTADQIVVDIPIGLCSAETDTPCCDINGGERSRRCDDVARSVVRPRWSSVFTAPCREAAELAADDDAAYRDISDRNREVTGKGLSKQAANIAPAIAAVDELLRERDGDPDVLVEGHPEVCFRAFTDGPLQHNKRTAPGVATRLEALAARTEYEAGTWRDLAVRLADEERTVDLDDLLDALALALTARANEAEFHRLPSAEPPRDAVGLPMQMVYRRPEPFEHD
jgi:predicted RNase H-like nuclease